MEWKETMEIVFGSGEQERMEWTRLKRNNGVWKKDNLNLKGGRNEGVQTLMEEKKMGGGEWNILLSSRISRLENIVVVFRKWMDEEATMLKIYLLFKYK